MAAAGNAVVWSDGRLWSLGGTHWRHNEKSWLARVDSWCPGDDRWRPECELDQPMAHGVAAPAPGGLLWIGGGASDAATDAVRRLTFGDPVTTRTLSPLPQPLAAAGGGVVGDTAVVVGGVTRLTDLSSARRRCWTLDLVGRRGWRAAPDLPDGPRAICASTVCGGELLAFGGCRLTAGEGLVNLCTSWAWSPHANAWRQLADLPAATRGATAVCVDSRFVFILGGHTCHAGQQEFSRQVLVYDRELDRYAPTLPLPQPQAVTAAAIAEGRLYLAGGEDAPRSRSASVWIGTLSL